MSKALIVSKVDLSPVQRAQLEQPTPAVYIRTKPGRGNRPVRYVEGGFVIARLNQVLGPLNWSFQVTERGESARKNETSAEGEVWVKGELTIHDHKSGAKVTKVQFGQHPIHKNVPVGDAFKAAGTDALKKCAAMLGIGLDVMWAGFDSGRQPSAPEPVVAQEVVEERLAEQPKPRVGSPVKPKAEQRRLTVYEMTLKAIENTDDPVALANLIQRIKGYDEFSDSGKKALIERINAKLARHAKEAGTQGSLV